MLTKFVREASVLILGSVVFFSFQDFSYSAAENLGGFLPPFRESEAYHRYQGRSPSELSKLLYLMDRFRNTQFQVIYEGTTYDSNQAVDYARRYLASHYHQEKAERWIKDHAYRSGPGGRVIYMKYPDGKKRPARDVLLDELKALEQA